jgi:DNA-binding NarL/FixJ family response regulator
MMELTRTMESHEMPAARSPQPSAIRVLLVDDHEAVRQGLAMLLNAVEAIDVVGEACDGRDVVDLARQLSPHVVVMDVAMPGMNGLAATQALRRAFPTISVVALTRHSDDAYVQELLRAGASGYVLKQSSSSELVAAVRAVANGQHYLDSTLRERLSSAFMRRHYLTDSPPPSLSERETVVLRDIAWGYGNKEIAARLDLSVKTVEVHKANAMRKLGLHGRLDVVRYALLQGWLQEG